MNKMTEFVSNLLISVIITGRRHRMDPPIHIQGVNGLNPESGRQDRKKKVGSQEVKTSVN